MSWVRGRGLGGIQDEPTAKCTVGAALAAVVCLLSAGVPRVLAGTHLSPWLGLMQGCQLRQPQSCAVRRLHREAEAQLRERAGGRLRLQREGGWLRRQRAGRR